MEKRQKVFLIVHSALCALLAVLLAVAAIGIYREGIVVQAENPLAWIYSPEIIAEWFWPIVPVLLLGAYIGYRILRPTTGRLSTDSVEGDMEFTGVIIPGWYDCHCDIPLPGDKFKIVDSMPLAVGALYYTGDKVNGVAAKRGFTVGIGLAE